MSKSSITKRYSRLSIFFLILSVLATLIPCGVYVAQGIMTSTLLIQKVVIVSTVFMAIVLTLICLVNKVVFRSKIWLLIISLFFVIDNFITMILIFAITQTIDEIVLQPLHKHYKNKAIINKEIDKRGI